MKVAIYRNVRFNYECVWDVPHAPLSVEWIRTSSWVEVDFPPLSAEEQQQAQKLLELAEREKTAEKVFEAQRNALKAERAALNGSAS